MISAEPRLLETIELMKKHRVLKVKLGALEIELSPSAFAPDVVTAEKGEPWAGFKFPTPEAFLTASIPDSMFDQPETRKEDGAGLVAPEMK